MALLSVVTAQKPRQIAARILRDRLADARHTEALLETALDRAALPPADRRLCQELVYGVVRWQAALDWLIARKTSDRPQKPMLRILLQLGLYQMFWLDRIPDHAAVNESVALAREMGLSQQAGFVNAVLRGYGRAAAATARQLAELKISDPPVGYSHPVWLWERWRDRWGADNAARLMDWNNTPPPTCARVNLLKTDPEKLTARWATEGVAFAPVVVGVPPAGEGGILPPGSPSAHLSSILHPPSSPSLSPLPSPLFSLSSHPSLATLPSFQDGWFYVQDPSTLLAVIELDPKPGETVLDACAAPGGKTAFIAQLMENRGLIVAEDTDPARLALVRENCTRLGVTCVQTGVTGEQKAGKDFTEGNTANTGQTEKPFTEGNDPSSAVASGVRTRTQALLRRTGGNKESAVKAIQAGSLPASSTSLPSVKSAPIPQLLFDRILVDAPCSNTGVMRRRVDLRWRVRPEEIERLRRAQLDLLRQAAARLKPGGTLVYSTCSLEPEENGSVVREFLAQHPSFKLDRERELLPFADGVDGAYVAKLTTT
jgi:16S rRNA (cytosine967-C5)-methyltransferase